MEKNFRQSRCGQKLVYNVNMVGCLQDDNKSTESYKIFNRERRYMCVYYVVLLDLVTKSPMSRLIWESRGLRKVPSFLQKSLGGELLPAATHTEGREGGREGGGVSEVTETVTVAVLLVYKHHCIEAEWSKMLAYI